MRSLLLTLILGLFGLVSYSQLTNSGELLQKAGSHYQKEEYKKTIELLLRVPRNDTNFRLAQIQLSDAYMADSNYQAALKVVEQNLVEGQLEFRTGFLKNKGVSLDRLGRSKEALAFYDDIIKKYPNVTEFLIDKSILYIRAKDWTNAEKTLKEILVRMPYSSASHFRLAYCAMQQGRVVPAMMSAYTSLLVNPDGDFFRNSITLLSNISKGHEELEALTSNRTEPEPVFAQAEQIILSRIALDKDYKLKSALDDAIIRQLQALMEVIRFNAAEEDFWMQFYVPLLKDMYTKSFEATSYFAFSAVDLDPIQKYIKKNQKELDASMREVYLYLNKIRDTRVLNVTERANAAEFYHYDDGVLIGKGAVNDKGVPYGPWEFYYPNGNLKALGLLTKDSKKTGEWKFYNELGYLSGVSNWVDDELEGEDRTYNENGILTVSEFYKKGKLNGERKTYFAIGHLKSVTTYVDNEETGLHTEYFSTGRKAWEKEMKKDAADGKSISFYNNGIKEEEGSYKNGELDGKWITYHRNGQKSFEGVYKEGKLDGEALYYHSNGKLKEKSFLKDGKLEGENLEYTEDGMLETKTIYKNGEPHGIAEYFGYHGKLYSTFEFENGILKTARYFDKGGKEISSSTRKNKQIVLTVYNADGFKASVSTYDDKAQLQGTQTYFHNSGQIRETNIYEDGALNGVSVGYYPDGTKEYEIPYEGDEKNGVAKYYHPNGKLRSIGSFVQGVATAEWLDYNEQGNLVNVYNYLDSEFEGFSESRYANGKPDYEEVYHKGWITALRSLDTLGNLIHEEKIDKNGNGIYRSVYANGKTRFQVKYVNGEFDGEYVLYYFNGKPRLTKNYNKGLLDGSHKEFYLDGQLLAEGNYKLGDRVGLWKYYSESGKIWKEENYEGGELNGKMILYHDNGKIDREIDHRGGQRHGTMKRYADNGELMAVYRYYEDVVVGYSYPDKSGNLIPDILIAGGIGHMEAYYASGQKSISIHFLEGKVHGVTEFFYPDGKKMYIGNDIYGISHGKQLYYHSNGKLKEDHNYYYDNLDGWMKDYFDNGQLKEEAYYQFGRANGTCTIYSQDGKVVRKEQIYYGVINGISK